MKELEGILKFMQLTHEFQEVERAVPVRGKDRAENDAEHSYQLALVAWYVIRVNKLELDIDKVLKYALLHDLVEVYAGDTNAYDPDESVHATKLQREHDALARLAESFTEFPEMTETIVAYEQRADEESKFVYAFDKMLPPLNIYLDNGRTWHTRGQSLEKMIARTQEKVDQHPAVSKYFQQMVEMLEQDQDRLFPKPYGPTAN